MTSSYDLITYPVGKSLDKSIIQALDLSRTGIKDKDGHIKAVDVAVKDGNKIVGIARYGGHWEETKPSSLRTSVYARMCELAKVPHMIPSLVRLSKVGGVH